MHFVKGYFAACYSSWRLEAIMSCGGLQIAVEEGKQEVFLKT